MYSCKQAKQHILEASFRIPNTVPVPVFSWSRSSPGFLPEKRAATGAAGGARGKRRQADRWPQWLGVDTSSFIFSCSQLKPGSKVILAASSSSDWMRPSYFAIATVDGVDVDVSWVSLLWNVTDMH